MKNNRIIKTITNLFRYNFEQITGMKKIAFLLCLVVLLSVFSFYTVEAQCSICTRTAQQMGEKPAKALNTGILYLAAAPLAIAGFIGYRWWKGAR